MEGQAAGTCLGAVDQDALIPQAPGLPLEGLAGGWAAGLGALDGRQCPLIEYDSPQMHEPGACVHKLV